MPHEPVLVPTGLINLTDHDSRPRTFPTASGGSDTRRRPMAALLVRMGERNLGRFGFRVPNRPERVYLMR